jgi:hypothetical protein
MKKEAVLTARKTERDRIAFIEQRDGTDGAVHFAQRTLAIYQSALRFVNKDPAKAKHHFARSLEYLPEYVGSVLELKRFLRERGPLGA